VGHTLVT